MTLWRVYYANGLVVSGKDQADWLAAPNKGVQVIVLMESPAQSYRRWFCYKIGSIEDRQLWTGEDKYDPFGWGVKFGSWMPRADYDVIWECACGDD